MSRCVHVCECACVQVCVSVCGDGGGDVYGQASQESPLDTRRCHWENEPSSALMSAECW